MLAEEVNEPLREVRTDVSQVARLAEVKLDGHKLVFQFHVQQTGADTESLELVKKVGVCVGAQIRKVNL